MYYPLIENWVKIAKIDNKFMKNQWKSMKSFHKIDRKSSEIDYNLTSNWPEFLLKIPQKWYKNLNAVRPLRGHKIGQFPTKILTKWYKNFDAVNPMGGHFHV